MEREPSRYCTPTAHFIRLGLQQRGFLEFEPLSLYTKKHPFGCYLKNGARDEARTRDPFLGKEVFYH